MHVSGRRRRWLRVKRPIALLPGLSIKPHAGEADTLEALRMRVLVIVQEFAMTRANGFQERVSGREATDSPGVSFLGQNAEVAGHVRLLHLFEQSLVHVTATLELRLVHRLPVAELRADVGQVAANDVKD